MATSPHVSLVSSPGKRGLTRGSAEGDIVSGVILKKLPLFTDVLLLEIEALNYMNLEKPQVTFCELKHRFFFFLVWTERD